MCEQTRCAWAGDLPIHIEYHDNEWGRPVHDDNRLFEMLILELTVAMPRQNTVIAALTEIMYKMVNGLAYSPEYTQIEIKVVPVEYKAA